MDGESFSNGSKNWISILHPPPPNTPNFLYTRSEAKEAEREGGEGSAEAQRALRGEVVEGGEGVPENKSLPHRGGGIPPPV